VTMKQEAFSGMKKWLAGGAAAAVLTIGAVGARTRSQEAARNSNEEKVAMTTENKFYCDIAALNPAERAKHKQLTDKLITVRKEIVETEGGYEFQFSPSDVAIAELAGWVDAEGKCCPFFDFHIDQEREGKLLCLRLTGAPGIKAFIRMEFAVPAK
jgi:hypothetical protein